MEEKIHKQRIYWQEKAFKQLGELMMTSLERDKQKYQKAREDLDTTLIILWRFDGKLNRLRAKLTAEQVDEGV